MMATAQDLDDLRAFMSRTKSLVNRRLITSGALDSGFSINFDRTSGIRLDALEPDEEDLRSFMTDFRPFTIPKERVHLGRTMNVLEQSLTDAELRAVLRDVRDGWKLAQ